jgi:transcriptional regulator GlxA family with amidase domain
VSAHPVAVVAFDGFQLLDLAGPLDVLRAASLLGATPPYGTTILTPGGEPARADSGVTIAADDSLLVAARRRERIGTLLVVGGMGVDAVCADPAAVAAVRRLAGRADRVASVCSGALLLAAAGVLDGRRATTHWSACERLALRHPAVEVEADRIYVRDGHVWTSAGVTAGTDLALALVEHDHGPELAHAVAGWLVVFVRRPGGQAQFSAQLLAQPARSGPVSELQRWLPDHLDEDLTVDGLAARVGMSPRNLARRFKEEAGVTPASYVEALRVEAARRLLESSDLTVAAVARRVGVAHAETLHRAFRKRLGTTPQQYRRHFSRAS